jgi:alkanesulfonate monooxygenase SsuD/methylene tetrahydromethanopterin reductase-like flavin-dependent oxidoreductase (luciferase family)
MKARERLSSTRTEVDEIWGDVGKKQRHMTVLDDHTLVGSYASVARMLDEAAGLPGTKGLMLTFDDFLIGMEQFGQRIQPVMRSRQARLTGAA